MHLSLQFHTRSNWLKDSKRQCQSVLEASGWHQMVSLLLITLIDPVFERGPDVGRRLRAVFGVL